MSAKVLTAAARFRVTHGSVLAIRQDQMGIGTQRRQPHAIRRLKRETRQRYSRLRRSGTVGKMAGEIDQRLFELATEHGGHTVRAKTFGGQNRVKTIGAELGVRIQAANRIQQLQRQARRRMHGHIKRNQARLAHRLFRQ